MEELAVRLDGIKREREKSKKRTPTEEIEESYNKHHAMFMGRREFAGKQKAIIADKYANDPEMLARSEEFLRDWLREGV
jgi:hypothetical protein